MHRKKAGELQTGNTFPKQYWLAVNGKPKRKQGSFKPEVPFQNNTGFP